MDERRLPANRYLSDAQANYLRFELRIGNDPKRIKRALQDICEAYEGGRRLVDPDDHRQLIHSHLSGNNIVLRRWSLKALGLIGSRDDTVRIVERLRVEADEEAQTWGAAALLRTVRDRGIKEVCREANMDVSKALALSSRLYAPEDWVKNFADEVQVSLDDDDITLKWAIFLAGYGRAPEDLFDPKYSNEIFLGELNVHPSEQVAEYSVWALCERPEYGFENLKIPMDEILKQPENVRKWLYRLVAKSPARAKLIPSDFEGLWLPEQSISARDGLALAAGNLGPDFSQPILDWHDREPDRGVKENLLAAMAANPTHDPAFADTVEGAFRRSPQGSGLRGRLLAASSNEAKSPLYSSLRAIEIAEANDAKPQNLFTGPFVMNTGATFNVGGDLTAQNLAGGDMVGSANNAVQSITADRAQDKAVLTQVLEIVPLLAGYPGEQKQLEAAVKEAAEKPTPASKKGLLSVLDSLSKGVSSVANISAKLPGIIAAVAEWAG